MTAASRYIPLAVIAIYLCLPAGIASATEPLAIGWASYNALGHNGTTGGAGGPTVTVTNAAQLQSNIAMTGPRIILVQGTISMGQQEVKSDKTIIGIGTNPTIIGGFKVRSNHNVIIRNLIIKQSGADGVSIEYNAHHVWIDHCDLSNCYDGLIDITHAVDYVTVSWCRFSNHDKTCLLGHDDTNGAEDIGHLRVTYHHNWFNGSIERHPRVRFSALTHVYNNYYLGNYYGVASTCNAEVLVEGCFFQNVSYPLLVGYDLSPGGDLVERNNLYFNYGLWQTRGTVPEPSSFYTYTLDAAADVPTIVTAGSGLQSMNYLADDEAPRPSPMTWQAAPQAFGASAIMMTATMGTDGSGVQYYFACLTTGGHDSGWLSTPFYIDTGLMPETTYAYTVTARDASSAHNQTTASAPASATTMAPWSVPQISINFQPADITPPSGYLADTGLAFGARQGNLSYGWNVTHADNAAIRGVSSDLRLDTVIQLRSGGYWEMVLPNGEYLIEVGIGDSVASTHTINVEGVSYWNAVALAAGQFALLTKTVFISDGRLTINQGSAADKLTRIDYVIITPVNVQVDSTPPLPDPLTWQTPPTAEGGTFITMAATTASDAGVVEYYFADITDPNRDSGWQSGTSFTDSGLAYGASRTYKVRARDKTFFRNATGWSVEGSATTATFDCFLTLSSDLNASCHVDFLDFAVLAAAWCGERPPVDLNYDGLFDGFDVLKFTSEWLLCNRWPQTECWK